MQKLRVGVLGATGMVGQRFCLLLSDHPWFEPAVLAASPRSAGKPYREAVEGQWVGEPVFVPRAEDAEEDDGFVLNVLHDANRDRTAVDVLDARALDKAPLARLWLEERLPLGFALDH